MSFREIPLDRGRRREREREGLVTKRLMLQPHGVGKGVGSRRDIGSRLAIRIG